MPVAKPLSAKLQIHFASLNDPRCQKVKYPFINFIVITICGQSGGRRTSSSILEYVCSVTPIFLTASTTVLPLARSTSTLVARG